MRHATRLALIQTLQARLADEQAMMKKLRDRSIELDIEFFAADLAARPPLRYSRMPPFSQLERSRSSYPRPSVSSHTSACSRFGQYGSSPAST
jgi:hypothetical protein